MNFLARAVSAILTIALGGALFGFIGPAVINASLVGFVVVPLLGAVYAYSAYKINKKVWTTDFETKA